MSQPADPRSYFVSMRHDSRIGQVAEFALPNGYQVFVATPDQIRYFVFARIGQSPTTIAGKPVQVCDARQAWAYLFGVAALPPVRVRVAIEEFVGGA